MTRHAPTPRWHLLVLALICAVVILPARMSHTQNARDPIVVGSKAFAENRLLAEIVAQLIEARLGVDVERREGLGGTSVAFEALRGGTLDMYPEYTGTGWAVLLGREQPVRNALEAYDTVRREFDRQYELEWMPPFGFHNGYALAVTRETAESFELEAISDLRAYQDELVAGVSHEFLEREDGWPGLSAAYDLELQNVRGIEHSLAYDAVERGNVDVIDCYTTDGALARYDLVLLADDRAYFPPYDAAMVVRQDTLQAYPELESVLGELAYRIDAERMQALNAAIEVDQRGYAEVAQDFLIEEGLLATDVERVEGSGRDGTWSEFLYAQRGRLLQRTLEHLALTLAAVLFACLIAVPLGILVASREGLEWVITAAGIAQTVPGLALLALLMPVTGLNATTAVIALTIYAILPILRTTASGLTDIDSSLIEAGIGLGMRNSEILREIRLPLAVPAIMAGVRTAAVITVGFAVLAAFISAGGLGEPILTGLDLRDNRLVLLGAVPSAILAVIVDTLLGRLEARLRPRGA